MTKRVMLSQEIKEALKKVRWTFAASNLYHSGKKIARADYLVDCTSLYLRGLGIKHPNLCRPVWYNANDGTSRCSRPLRAALLKACGVKEPR